MTRTGRRALVLVAAALLARAGPARAADEAVASSDFFSGRLRGDAPRPPLTTTPSFGARGQVVVGGDSSVGVSSSEFSSIAATNLTLTVSPTVDYFFVKDLSLGLSVDLSYATAEGNGGAKKILLTHSATASEGPASARTCRSGAWPRSGRRSR